MYDSGLLRRIWQLSPNEILKDSKFPSDPSSKQLRSELLKLVASEKGSLLEKGKRSAEELKRQHVVFVPRGHSRYPEMFNRLIDPPRWIFLKGSSKALQSSSIIAVVGTRTASSLGQKLANQCAAELAKRNIIVLSGLAKGIDESAHAGATDSFGQSIAVLGQGITSPEAADNLILWNKILDCDGAIVSEYLPLDPPSRQNFLRRNELQVALSQVVIPVECPSLESGTGATIRRALAIGTPIVGIFPAIEHEKTLELTRNTLTKLEIPVFTVRNGNSGEFWDYLKQKMPKHNWTLDPTISQDRLFAIIERLVLAASNKVDLDEPSIDRLAQRLKGKIKE